MITNVEVAKNANENNASLIRRFTRRIQGSGILPRLRSSRYHERDMSKYKKKAAALKRLAKKAEVEHLKKLGKM